MPSVIVKKLQKIAHNLKHDEILCETTFRHEIFDAFLTAIEHRIGCAPSYHEADEPFKGYSIPFDDLAEEYIRLTQLAAPWEDLLGEIYNDFGLQASTFPNFSWKDAMIYAVKNVKTYITPPCTVGLQTIVDMDNLSSSILLANIATLDKQGADLSKYRVLSVHDDMTVLRMIRVQIACNLSIRDGGFGEVLIAERAVDGLKPIYHCHHESISSLLEELPEQARSSASVTENISAIIH